MSPPPREPEDAELLRAYRHLQTPGSEKCPDTDALATLALGQTSPDERQRLADHVVACRQCSESYQILARTHDQVSQQLAGARRLRWWFAAAAITLVAAGGLIVLRSARREEALRGGSREKVSVVPADGATLAVPPSLFRWPPQPQAESYGIKLFASDGERLWEADAGAANRLEFPGAARSRLQPGRSYFWTVEVQMPLENRRLGPFSFTLRR